ncbi:xanthine phosphoribosyltransferase [Cohnella nanjingensis]|uniref:Xanthine phosphoribosyltransferase n=1 Tax=Cohnella nanjingensis TaxID=1387779 RepID=A0A7X0VIG2_9BACL|nr:xanthine phosphoribosyltransferase [Cohnella nanjingensis]MBB6675172.1 xanthine phosphoribosyltransferase [Cohnella nanjingensis]
MDMLKQRIREEATVVSAGVLKLDSLLNHGVDPVLTMELGKEFARRFAERPITKVITIESSGIPVAFATALTLGVPLVFARRKKTLLNEPDAYCERVPSFTKGIVTDLLVSRHLLGPEDSVLFIDDIIANGDAARGLLKIIEQSGARLEGIGIVLEKSFQAGGKALRELGFQVESLVKIASLEGNEITFAED